MTALTPAQQEMLDGIKAKVTTVADAADTLLNDVTSLLDDMEWPEEWNAAGTYFDHGWNLLAPAASSMSEAIRRFEAALAASEEPTP